MGKGKGRKPKGGSESGSGSGSGSGFGKGQQGSGMGQQGSGMGPQGSGMGPEGSGMDQQGGTGYGMRSMKKGPKSEKPEGEMTIEDAAKQFLGICKGLAEMAEKMMDERSLSEDEFMAIMMGVQSACDAAKTEAKYLHRPIPNRFPDHYIYICTELLLKGGCQTCNKQICLFSFSIE